MITYRKDAKNCCSPARNGFVLIVVLVIVMLMSVAAYGFLVSMQTENIAARTSGDQLAAQQCAYSGLEWAAAMLELPAAQRQELVAGGERQQLFDVSVSDEQSSTASAAGAKCLIVQPLPADPEQVTELPLGMINESGKIHLMTLLEWERTQPGAGRNALMRLPAMTGPEADAILDWIDADSQPRAEGAEADAYAQSPTPYSPRNGRPLDLDELLLVRGIDEFRLFGRDLPKAESARLASENRSLTVQSQRPWSEFLTVWSAERNAALVAVSW